MPSLTISICATGLGSTVFDTGRENPLTSFSTPNLALTLRIPSTIGCGGDAEERLITLKVASDSDQPLNCLEVGNCVEIRRDVEVWNPIDHTPAKLKDYPIARVHEPNHCCYTGSTIHGHLGASDISGTLFAKNEKTPEERPTILAGQYEKTDCGGTSGSTDFDILDNGVMVPGMTVRTIHRFKLNDRAVSRQCSDIYYRTCSLTGGRVLEVIGDYNDPDITFLVACEGAEVVARPSDFVDWAVGDWVFLVAIDDDCTMGCDIDNSNMTGGDVAEDGATVSTVFISLLNDLRSGLGLAPVTWNADLNTAAENHAVDMVENDFFSHRGTGGTYVLDRVEATGYHEQSSEWGVGENIAKWQQTAKEVFNDWKASPGHYANMIDANFKEIGLAARRNQNNDFIWVNVFGYRGGDNPTETESGTVGHVIVPLQIGNIKAGVN